MERSRKILLGSLGALTVAAISTVTWMAGASDDDSSASVGTEPSANTASTSWRPAPTPKPVRLDPIIDAPRSSPKVTRPAPVEAPEPVVTSGSVKFGPLEIDLRGIQAIHDAALYAGATPGPITATLGVPTGPGSEDFAKFKAKGMFQGERVAFDGVPLGLEFLLSVKFGPKDDQGELHLRVGGSGTKKRMTVDLDAKRKAENGVIGTLRSLAAAQQQLQASAAIDTDADGGGEHGYLAELAGTATIRQYTGPGASATRSGIKLDPTYLPASFGELTPVSSGAALLRGGYAYQVYLPADNDQRPIRGIAEDLNGGAGVDMPGASNAEIMWCAYAWPVDRHDAPWATFFINQSGDVMKTGGATAQRYSGLHGGPAFDAVFTSAGDMGSEPGLAAAGLMATDGNIWTPVGN